MDTTKTDRRQEKVEVLTTRLPVQCPRMSVTHLVVIPSYGMNRNFIKPLWSRQVGPLQLGITGPDQYSLCEKVSNGTEKLKFFIYPN